MWPSTILVQAFYLVYGAMLNILKGIYLSFVLSLGVIYAGMTALMTWSIVALLYGLSRPNEKGQKAEIKVVIFWACCNFAVFSAALSFLGLSNDQNNAGESMLDLGLEAGWVVIEWSLLVVAVAVFVKMAVIVAAHWGAFELLEELRQGQDASGEEVAAEKPEKQ